MEKTIYAHKRKGNDFITLSLSKEPMIAVDFRNFTPRNEAQKQWQEMIKQYENYRDELHDRGIPSKKQRGKLWKKRKQLFGDTECPFTQEDIKEHRLNQMEFINPIKIEVDGRLWKSHKYRQAYVSQLQAAWYLNGSIQHHKINGKVQPVLAG